MRRVVLHRPDTRGPWVLELDSGPGTKPTLLEEHAGKFAAAHERALAAALERNAELYVPQGARDEPYRAGR